MIAYTKFHGDIADISTVTYALAQLKSLALKNVEIVMDNGYYSADHVGEFLHAKQHFITRVKPNNAFVKDIVDKVLPDLIGGTSAVKRIAIAPEYSGYYEKKQGEFSYKRVRGSIKKGLKAGDIEIIEEVPIIKKETGITIM